MDFYETLPTDFYARSADQVAPDLVGRYIVRRVSGERLVARIVETEAYLGAPDRASHAWGGRRTPRSEVLYSAPGTAYVYLIYGIYHCLNAVTGDCSNGDAVLIRAAEPLDGFATMRRNRSLAGEPGPGDLAGGPGKLCQALAIDLQDNARMLTRKGLHLTVGESVSPGEISAGPRIGIDYAGEAKDWPLRFSLTGNPHVSKPRP